MPEKKRLGNLILMILNAILGPTWPHITPSWRLFGLIMDTVLAFGIAVDYEEPHWKDFWRPRTPTGRSSGGSRPPGPPVEAKSPPSAGDPRGPIYLLDI